MNKWKGTTVAHPVYDMPLIGAVEITTQMIDNFNQGAAMQ